MPRNIEPRLAQLRTASRRLAEKIEAAPNVINKYWLLEECRSSAQLAAGSGQ